MSRKMRDKKNCPQGSRVPKIIVQAKVQKAFCQARRVFKTPKSITETRDIEREQQGATKNQKAMRHLQEPLWFKMRINRNWDKTYSD